MEKSCSGAGSTILLSPERDLAQSRKKGGLLIADVHRIVFDDNRLVIIERFLESHTRQLSITLVAARWVTLKR